MRFAAALVIVFLGAVPISAPGAPLQLEFRLEQNDPNPFCPSIAVGETTLIRYEVPQISHVLIQVFTPDTTVALQTLVDGLVAEGRHVVIWDGRFGGVPVAKGLYPYRMIATEPSGPPILADLMQVATVSCEVPVEEGTWGAVKSLFRPAD